MYRYNYFAKIKTFERCDMQIHAFYANERVPVE